MNAPSGWGIAQTVAVSTAAWTALFGLVSYLQPCRSYGWNGRTVAGIHGLTVSIMSLAFGVWNNQSPFTQPGGVSNFFEVFVQVTCLGYFIFDTTFCLAFRIYGRETHIMAVHHVVAMAGMMTSLWMGVSGTEVSVAIGLMECTNPMFQLRWFLREVGLRKGDTWYEINDLAFVFSYVIIRGVIAQYLSYCVVTHPQTADPIKFFAVAMGVMNAILFVGILEYALKRYTAMLWHLTRGDRASEARIKSPAESVNKNQLSNSTDTFEEITMHKSLGFTMKYIKQQLLFKHHNI
ncbi:TLC domain-containing protein 5-like [Patiria miniata]|uniref:TLC domain-containing protein n=1 Tax=Patiria miniata TaxID=46514 RepID=A0A914ANH5_PATMI|nr:TLC domain-containing protein 5-like [Patiria miniata]